MPIRCDNDRVGSPYRIVFHERSDIAPGYTAATVEVRTWKEARSLLRCLKQCLDVVRIGVETPLSGRTMFERDPWQRWRETPGAGVQA
jgi:hypothetical protein